MRKHTKTTLKVLDDVTILFAKALRYFAEVTCPAFDTEETEREYDIRRRAHENRQKRAGNSASASTFAGGKQKRTFSLTTYKLHSLGDYVDYIRRCGTTSAQPGSAMSESDF